MVPRHITDVVLTLMQDEPVVLVQGPRSVGKTTLLLHIAEKLGAEVVDLDDLATRDAARGDPALFVGGDPPVCIDEYQHVPELLDAIKSELNRDGSAGRFLLTGSTRHDALPKAAQALTGRLHVVDVLPLAQGEIDGRTEQFVQLLLNEPNSLVTREVSTTTREEYIRRVCAGGFPLALGRSERSRSRWFDNYVKLSLERDIAELDTLRKRDKLPALLARLAGQTAQVININAVAQDLGLAHHTATDYTRLLEAVFLVHQLPAWGTTLTSRTAVSPKIHVVDSGLAARLLRVSLSKLAGRDASSLQQFGRLLETFVVAECRKQLSWLDDIPLVGHWRTRDGVEVDLVIEGDDGRVAAIEVKAGSRVRGDDLTGLQQLRNKLGERFVAGAALYTGERSYSPDDRIYVFPVDRLWS
ncbi:MAG: ATP-binding protein [Nitriliruptoraceae bacterium]